MTDTYSVRPGRADELATVQEIERRAAGRLSSVGLPAAVGLPIHPMEELREDCSHGRILVAVDHEDRPVGFALFDLLEDEAHLREIDVVPEHAGRVAPKRFTAVGHPMLQ